MYCDLGNRLRRKLQFDYNVCSSVSTVPSQEVTWSGDGQKDLISGTKQGLPFPLTTDTELLQGETECSLMDPQSHGQHTKTEHQKVTAFHFHRCKMRLTPKVSSSPRSLITLSPGRDIKLEKTFTSLPQAPCPSASPLSH